MFNDMKKYLFIFSVFISFNIFALDPGEVEILQDINSNVADLETNVQILMQEFQSPSDLPTIYEHLSIIANDLNEQKNSVFWIEEIAGLMYELSDFTYPEFSEKLDFLPSIFYHLSDNWQDIVNGFNLNHTDLVEVSQAIRNLEGKQEALILGTNGQLELMGNNLQEIIGLLQDQSGGSSGDLPIETVGFYDLSKYGKDVDIQDLPFQSVTTTGEYNKDVLRLLLNLNKVGGSQLNSSLSILTNVQAIAESVTGEGQEEKAEKDVEERRYKADSAISEGDSINSLDWSSFFTAPRFLSDSWNSLTLHISDVELPDRITIIDTFHKDIKYFSFELDNIGFDLSNAAKDLAFYARQVFGFIYWSLGFLIAFYVSKLWFNLYMYVSKALFNT